MRWDINIGQADIDTLTVACTVKAPPFLGTAVREIHPVRLLPQWGVVQFKINFAFNSIQCKALPSASIHSSIMHVSCYSHSQFEQSHWSCMHTDQYLPSSRV